MGRIYFVNPNNDGQCDTFLKSGQRCVRDAYRTIDGVNSCWQHDPARVAGLAAGSRKTKRQEREERRAAWIAREEADRVARGLGPIVVHCVGTGRLIEED